MEKGIHGLQERNNIYIYIYMKERIINERLDVWNNEGGW